MSRTMVVGGPSVRWVRLWVVCTAAAFALAGCFPFDFPPPDAPPQIQIQNNRDETVVVRILGTLRGEDVVEAGDYKLIRTEECLGDGLVIEDVDGNVIAERDGEVCPGTIWLRSDGSVSVSDGSGTDEVAPPTP